MVDIVKKELNENTNDCKIIILSFLYLKYKSAEKYKSHDEFKIHRNVEYIYESSFNEEVKKINNDFGCDIDIKYSIINGKIINELIDENYIGIVIKDGSQKDKIYITKCGINFLEKIYDIKKISIGDSIDITINIINSFNNTINGNNSPINNGNNNINNSNINNSNINSDITTTKNEIKKTENKWIKILEFIGKFSPFIISFNK